MSTNGKTQEHDLTYMELFSNLTKVKLLKAYQSIVNVELKTRKINKCHLCRHIYKKNKHILKDIIDKKKCLACKTRHRALYSSVH